MCASVPQGGVALLAVRRLPVLVDAAMAAHVVWALVCVGRDSLERIVQIRPAQMTALVMELANKVGVDVELAGLETCAFLS